MPARRLVAGGQDVALFAGLPIRVEDRSQPGDVHPECSLLAVRLVPPQVVEDQVTYPLTTTLLAVPRAQVVRGYSFFGFSFVYIIFEDGTDLYWARSRVLEYLNFVRGRLPQSVNPALGPDATGVGWAFMYVLNSPSRPLDELRSLQDWFLKYELQTVPGVAEVATVGGMVRQYQVIVDPDKSTTVESADVLYKCGWSPFEGHTFSSTIDTTIVNGEVVWRDGRLTGAIAGKRMGFARSR